MRARTSRSRCDASASAEAVAVEAAERLGGFELGLDGPADVLDARIADVELRSDRDAIGIDAHRFGGREHQRGAQIHRELDRGRFGLPNARHAGRHDLDVARHLKAPQRLAVAAARDEERAVRPAC